MLNLWAKWNLKVLFIAAKLSMLFGKKKEVVQDIPEPKPLNISEPTYLIEKYLRSNPDKLEFGYKYGSDYKLVSSPMFTLVYDSYLGGGDEQDRFRVVMGLDFELTLDEQRYLHKVILELRQEAEDKELVERKQKAQAKRLELIGKLEKELGGN